MLRALKELKRTMCSERKRKRCPTQHFWDAILFSPNHTGHILVSNGFWSTPTHNLLIILIKFFLAKCYASKHVFHCWQALIDWFCTTIKTKILYFTSTWRQEISNNNSFYSTLHQEMSNNNSFYSEWHQEMSNCSGYENNNQ